MKHRVLILLFIGLPGLSLLAQSLSARFDQKGVIHIRTLFENDIAQERLFSFLLNDTLRTTDQGVVTFCSDDSVQWQFAQGISVKAMIIDSLSQGLKISLTFTNRCTRTLKVENFVPFSEGKDKVYITAQGSKDWPQYLCRSVLCRPGYSPVGVVLPDNAWHLGFADMKTSETHSLVSLARRGKRENAEADRWAVTLKPGGWVDYTLWIDVHSGEWQEGLNLLFRKRYLYDLESFDNTLFERKDLQFMKGQYLMLLRFAWDHQYYDALKREISFYNAFHEYDHLLGGWDIFTLWPTWPRLGLDARNQWDMYRDLPGGLDGLKKLGFYLHQEKKKFFISYNPWDESTRKEDQLKGLENILSSTQADGVVLDTRGESSKELQECADRVKPGIVMYSEGMAVVKDMPGILAGRVHDALYMPPPINLNKFIKPDFAIFRVSQLADGPLHRESCVAFFNGYGTELNFMRPGRPQWIEEELAFLGKTTQILRENTGCFTDKEWTPLLPNLKDSIWINRWKQGNKTLFTIFSLIPEGFSGPLFEATVPQHHHTVSLWRHEEVPLDTLNGKTYLVSGVSGFDKDFIGTRKEGNVDCIAVLPELLSLNYEHGRLTYTAKQGNRVRVWAGDPSYGKLPAQFNELDKSITLYDYFGRAEEKFVIQVLDGDTLLDEQYIHINLATPRLVSEIKFTEPSEDCPRGMKMIPAGLFSYVVKRDSNSQEAVIPFPDYSKPENVVLQSYFMDIYPVTNKDYQLFLEKSGYKPKDTTNFLKHWHQGKPRPGTENHPVVYVCLEDARAYAEWSGKRLPTEREWQYAAQGISGNPYPWGQNPDNKHCNFNLGHTTAVSAFPRGKSPFGIMDLIGNIWQMTNDIYDNGSYYFNIIRGGSYYHPSGSQWYMTGGPVSASHPEMLLMMGQGLDRCATVGFRCVKDKKRSIR
jgi:iron(II)-dependent oxidoreductase